MEYLAQTKLLDYRSETIAKLIKDRGWEKLSDTDRIRSIYNFVRDEIQFGYNEADAISASQILSDGYGQCNTKGVLLMALLRATGTPCRMHGFNIDKAMQKGAMKGIYYLLAPKEIVHSWVEINYNETWLNLEGFILDIEYLSRLQEIFIDQGDSFTGYGVATDSFKNPQIYWNENDTYIQKEGITQDFGVYNNPDDFFSTHPQGMGVLKNWIYRRIVRHLMNNNIRKIRGK